jgi:hypothetical protein
VPRFGQGVLFEDPAAGDSPEAQSLDEALAVDVDVDVDAAPVD